ncbi:MAG TPA: thioredoxin-disulfide reductase [Flavobacteriales bacterium]|jgi:thioredoxin reductase (NADPH)|nr:thioredoxin-disulfide reductase [Flavobacteriales bacterium]|tara:strand:+ start:3354 stop:4292 length:939 start_codon:yes stop_codon:yes gene_type:complete
MSNNIEKIKTLIIGSGPAGYTAAIYAARADLHPVVIQGLQPGGQLTTTTDVDNYPGYKDGITGPEMMEDFKAQAERFGTDTRWGMVTKVDLSERPFKVEIDEKVNVLAETIIIATGASAKWLGMEDEKRLSGYGVSACATCDGFFYKGQDVVVVGAGDTAAEEATYLAKLCNKVTMLVRKDEMRASKAMQKRVFSTSNLDVLFHHETKSINGEKGVESVTAFNNQTGKEITIPIAGFFVAIGHIPNTDLFKGQLEMDKNGYLLIEEGTSRTKIPGVFAAGDVADHVYRQAVTSAGTGCMAALDAERFLAESK